MASEMEQLARSILNVPPANGSIETCLEQLPENRTMAEVCEALGVDDSGHMPVIFPASNFDLGREEVMDVGGLLDGIPHLVYATIDADGKQTCRVTAFPAWWREAE